MFAVGTIRNKIPGKCFHFKICFSPLIEAFDEVDHTKYLN